MTQQIRTISRANGLRRLTIIIAYHNRGIIARRSIMQLFRSSKISLDDIAIGSKENFASRGSCFSITIIKTPRETLNNVFLHTFPYLSFYYIISFSLAVQRNMFCRRVCYYSKGYSAFISLIAYLTRAIPRKTSKVKHAHEFFESM